MQWLENLRFVCGSYVWLMLYFRWSALLWVFQWVGCTPGRMENLSEWLVLEVGGDDDLGGEANLDSKDVWQPCSLTVKNLSWGKYVRKMFCVCELKSLLHLASTCKQWTSLQVWCWKYREFLVRNWTNQLISRWFLGEKSIVKGNFIRLPLRSLWVQRF